MGLEQRELHLDTHRALLLHKHRAVNVLLCHTIAQNTKFCQPVSLADMKILYFVSSSRKVYSYVISSAMWFITAEA